MNVAEWRSCGGGVRFEACVVYLILTSPGTAEAVTPARSSSRAVTCRLRIKRLAPDAILYVRKGIIPPCLITLKGGMKTTYDDFISLIMKRFREIITRVDMGTCCNF